MISKSALFNLFVLTFCFSVAYTQERPFLFTYAPSELIPRLIVLQYDAAYGRETFEPLGGDNVEQTVGVQTGLTNSIILSGKIGFATTNITTSTSQHIELLMRVIKSQDVEFDVSAGPGFRHEYSGTNVFLGRVIIGRRFANWQVYSNLLFEKPFSDNRDDLDLLLTMGCSYNISNVIHLGFEVVGQDLEGFWEADEAEGGATLFLGPTISAVIPESSYTLTLGAGPIIRATQSNRISSAMRDYPSLKENGFVIHAAINFGL